ncbi:acetyl-CoA carboxylase biotin carboxyl carrier protein [Cupriavidus sp. P-10]|uniref:acetyl-CoA carboxylase biotin carboxyl carrier protein n=1 Tax=unclassified Cupriavidus TaxID=2640874 RepID=UPI000EC847F1|nr:MULTISPECIES: biotin/lipoyl-containing protein [unclassified Cupriavidus]BDB24077.1 acetyl-CoA carboxylase biotin carboxyl carrier protein [Cupriavidus sp. P-10]
MPIDIDFIEQLIGILERSALSGLEYAEDSGRVRLVRSGAPEADATATLATPVQDAPAPVAAAIAPQDRTQTVSAPLSGMFYGAPAPGQPAFVAVGDLVEAGQQLAIIEAMKMLNTVEADHKGRVVRIVATDGASVEAGAPLFVIEPAGDDHD